MGCTQLRIGPMNVGIQGIPSSVINGCNLIISQLRVPKIHTNLVFDPFPIFFMMISLMLFVLHYPFCSLDVYYS